MPRRVRGAMVAALSVGLTASCGGDDSTSTNATSTVVAPPGVPDDDSINAAPPPGVSLEFDDEPPAVTLRSGADAIDVGPHSFSTRTMVADGTIPPRDGPAVVIEGAEVTVDYPLDGWTLVAQAEVPGGGTSPLTVEQVSPRSFRLVPPTAGTYDVWLTLRYRISDDNDEASAGYVFRWTVPPP